MRKNQKLDRLKGLVEATNDFNKLAKLAGKVRTVGTKKIVELKNGFKAILRDSTGGDGRLTLEIQRKTKELGSGAGKDIEIRYGTR